MLPKDAGTADAGVRNHAHRLIRPANKNDL
jgi:hypothetical protein